MRENWHTGPVVKTLFGSLVLALAATAAAERVWIGSEAREPDGGIYVADLDPASGEIRNLKLAAPLRGAGFQALHPSGKWLYSTCALPGGGGLAALRVHDDGTLELMEKRPTGGTIACHVSTDAAGKLVMAANYGDGTVCSLSLRDNGAFGADASIHRHTGSGPNTERQQGPHAHSIYPGPDDRFAYASDLGIDKVMIYRINRDRSTLEPAGSAPLPPGSGPRHLKFGKDGKMVYVLNELTLTVGVFTRQPADGSLAFRNVVPVLPDGESGDGMTCSEIRVSKDGRFVYTANRDTANKGRDSVSMLEITADGGLKRVQTVPAGVSIPRNIGLDPSGRWLLVCGQQSNDVTVLPVDPATGHLGPVSRKIPLKVPMCVTFADP